MVFQKMSLNKGSIIISRSGNVGRGPRIPGVLPSTRFGEQVVSTGIPSLDSYIGGGIPLGSVCLLKDTFPSRYADLVLKCFIAEGAVYSHHLYIASGNVSPKTFSSELPALRKQSSSSVFPEGHAPTGLSSGGNESELKIAWRYGISNPMTPAITKGQKDAKFEFKKKTSASELGASNLVLSELFDSNTLDTIESNELLKEIAASVMRFEIFNFDSTSENAAQLQKKPAHNLIRVSISHCEEQVLNPKFMMGLRALVRYTNSCAVLTVSNYNSCTDLESLQCDQMADYVIRFEAILDEKRKSELGDVDGICDVVKITSVNTLKPNEPPRDLGFSFRNKRLTFQELHIPPEGETTAQRETSKSKSAAVNVGLSCGATIKGKSIDF